MSDVEELPGTICMMPSRNSQKIGFIGLGVMGAPMAARLLDAGFEVATALHRRPLAAELAEKRVTVLETAADVASISDVVITMLPNTSEVESVLFDHGGVAEEIREGSLVIDMSSISPTRTIEFAQRIQSIGCEYVDAPVSGGEVGAKNGSLSVMVGGSAGAVKRAEPILRIVGSRVTHLGASGTGQVCKLANQIAVAVTIEAVAEALVFAAKCGADPALVREALLGGLASSRVLELHGERMLAHSFEPGFRVALHQKDLDLALQSAASVGVVLPASAVVQQLFNSVAAHDGSDHDHSALVTSLEILASYQI